MKPAIPLADILEKDWQKTVRDLAKTLGYRTQYHTFDSRRSDTGFPDLVLAKKGRLVFLELKREHGKVTPSQTAWVRALIEANAEVYVCRPRHMQHLATVLAGNATSMAFHEARGQLLIEVDQLLGWEEVA